MRPAITLLAVSVPSPPFRVLFAHVDILRRSYELVRALQSCLGAEPPCLVQVIQGARPFARLIQSGLSGGLPVHDVREASLAGADLVGVDFASPRSLSLTPGQCTTSVCGKGQCLVMRGWCCCAVRTTHPYAGART